jgi:EmrB/QacA subfamily drug resistance transporter
MTASTASPQGSLLATGRGKAILSLLCLATFLDIMDGAVVNVALPTIRTQLGFSVQNLQWLISGYLISYGGFLLLGGRAGDLLGRRRLLIAGTLLFAAASLACGLAGNQGLLVGGRLVQGFAAAMMTPAALSILTTTFQDSDRHKALGVWAGISGMASMVGIVLGGVLTQEFGWRWVFFISVPIAAAVLFGTFRLLEADHGRSVPGGFDAVGAVMVTASMLLLIFTLVKTPDVGWGAGRTIGGLAGAAVLMAGFLLNEQRRTHPLVPPSIFRIKGLAAADATQMIAWAGFSSMFFFITLYMQNVLGFSQLQSGLSLVPVSVGIGFGSTVATKMFVRAGTRPIIVTGALLAAGGILWLSRIPVDGTYLTNLLAPLVIMGLGLGLLYASVQTAANAGVPKHQAGLAAALITASFQLGSALGLAVFTGIATSRTSHLLAAHTPPPEALTAGFQRGLFISALCLVAAAAIALRAPNTRGEPATTPQTHHNQEPSYDPATWWDRRLQRIKALAETSDEQSPSR